MAASKKVTEILPHRPPMLLVDDVVSISGSAGDGEIHARKSLKGDEFFFQGHFPGHPVMPGVMIVESMLQTAGILMAHLGDGGSGLPVVVSLRGAEFLSPVKPGDTIDLFVKLTDDSDPLYSFDGQAKIGNATAAKASFECMMVESF